MLQLTVLLPPESMPEGRPTVTAVPSGEGAQNGPDARTPRTMTTMENSTSYLVCNTLIQQIPPTHSHSCLARAASHSPVDRWTSLLLTLLLFLVHIASCLRSCFTDKIRSKPLVSPLSLIAHKLASSPPPRQLG